MDAEDPLLSTVESWFILSTESLEISWNELYNLTVREGSKIFQEEEAAGTRGCGREQGICTEEPELRGPGGLTGEEWPGVSLTRKAGSWERCLVGWCVCIRTRGQ